MKNGVTHEELKKIALSWGRKPHAVRSAVDRGYIPSAEAIGGGGYAEPPKWIFPLHTDRKIRTLFRLQDLGYRGNTLWFALWWLKICPLNNHVREFVTSCFTSIERPVNKKIDKKFDSLGSDTVQKGGPSLHDDDLDRISVFATQISDWFKIIPENVVIELMKRLGLIGKLDRSNREHFFRAYIGAIFGLPFDRIEIYEEDSEEYKKALAQGKTTKEQIAFSNKFASLVNAGEIHEWILAQINEAPEDLITSVRTQWKRGPEYQGPFRKLSLLVSKIDKVTSERKKSRLGPQRYPEIWLRAFILGFNVSLEMLALEVEKELKS